MVRGSTPQPDFTQACRAPSKTCADATGDALVKTADGVEIRIEANVDLLGDATFARAQGAQGIGLFRSELLLAGRLPTS